MTFEEFYKENKEKLYFYALKKTSSKELSEDVSSETFFRVYKNWKTLENKADGEKRSWTYTVCRNLIIDIYRRKKASSLEFEPESDYESIMTTIIKEENKIEIHNAVKKLPPEKQEILELRFGQELKIKEISKILKKKEGACKMMLYRALEELKTHLENNQ